MEVAVESTNREKRVMERTHVKFNNSFFIRCVEIDGIINYSSLLSNDEESKNNDDPNSDA